ncbi:MAG: translation elongation factor 4 [Planctomycetota bacterium]|jgi:GTP-binding protein LepA
MSGDIVHTRNFCIIAHVDHGKSTLADRLMQLSGAITEREMKAQLLDSMDLERERGITIKASAVSIDYVKDNVNYEMNLIDTPGHVDFSYEVRRSLNACEGALLVVDAAQGIEAQTVANTYQALEADLEIIPVLNKIDLPNARPDDVLEELVTTFGFDPDEALLCSAKTGEGVPALLDAIVERVPAPTGDPNAPLQALIFDSQMDDYRGVIKYVRLMNGRVSVRDRVSMKQGEGAHEVMELGSFRPKMTKAQSLTAGNVGYVITGIKDLHAVTVGDTLVAAGDTTTEALPGYRQPKPMVFCGLYPTNTKDFENLRKALQRLSLNDSSFTFAPDSSDALGFGFRCGFLGLLHMEIVQERLERESDIDLVQTAPQVPYEVVTEAGDVKLIETAGDLPDQWSLQEFREMFVKLSLLCPTEYQGQIHVLCQERRGEFDKIEYLSPTRVMIYYDVPLASVVYDFHDKMKSVTRGFGTMDYEFLGYRPSDLVKLSIYVNKVEVDALSLIVHRSEAEQRGRQLLKGLRKEISRHMFEVVLQAGIGQRIIARERLAPLRKDVTAKCYGGDISRKRKLLEKQKEGKKRMKSVGSVEIPQKAFMSVLSSGDDGKQKKN